MYHTQIGSTDWPSTAAVLEELEGSLAELGMACDRFGLTLSRAMSVPDGERDRIHKETGPEIRPSEWHLLGEAAAIQPHLGDFMIGTPAGFEHARAALAGRRHVDRQPRAVQRVRAAGRPGRHPGHRGGDPRDRPARRVPRARRAGALVPRGRRRHAGVALRQLRRLGGARGVRRRGALRRPPRALLRRSDRRPLAPRGRPLRARRPPRARLDRDDGLRQHGRHAAARPRPQPVRADHVPAGRHRLPAPAPDRPRRASGAADGGGARPERRRERRGAGDRPRAGARGAAVRRPLRLAAAGAARRRPGGVRRAVPRPRARLPDARTASTSPIRRGCCSRCGGTGWAASSSASTSRRRPRSAGSSRGRPG